MTSVFSCPFTPVASSSRSGWCHEEMKAFSSSGIPTDVYCVVQPLARSLHLLSYPGTVVLSQYLAGNSGVWNPTRSESPVRSTKANSVWCYNTSGHAVAQLVEALRYKSERRGFDSRWSLEILIDIILPAALWPWVWPLLVAYPQLHHAVQRVTHGRRDISHVSYNYLCCHVPLLRARTLLCIYLCQVMHCWFLFNFVIVRFCHPHFTSSDHNVTFHGCKLFPSRM